MKNLFKKYLWVFEFFGAAVILAFGIMALAMPGILLVILGLTFIIFGIFRIIPLLKTTPDKLLKIIYIIEIALTVIVGVVLLIEGRKGDESELGNLFGYLVGGVLYLRALVHFFATSVRKEPSDYWKFFAHVGAFTIGTIILAKGNFEEKTLAIILLVLAIISALFISFSGYKHYKNNRYEMLAKEQIKKVKIKEKEEVIEDPLPEKEDVILPNREQDEKQDEVVS